MRLVVFTALVSLATAPGRAISAHGDVTIVVAERAVVAGSTYVLRDVAQVSAKDAEIKARLDALSVGVVPRMGYAQMVPRATIAQAVVKQWPEIAERIDWRGSEALVVRGAGVKYDSGRLVTVAREALLEQMSAQYARVEVTAVGGPYEMHHSVGQVLVTPRVSGPSPIRPRMRVWLDVSLDGRHYRSVPIWFAVKAYAPVQVAKRSMAARQRITSNDFRIEERNVVGIRGVPVPTGEVLGSAWLKRGIGAGEVLVDAAMESAPLIERGDDVSVKVVMGSIQIETNGIALANGRLGDTIKVENPGSREAFSGKVIGERAILISGELR